MWARDQQAGRSLTNGPALDPMRFDDGSDTYYYVLGLCGPTRVPTSARRVSSERTVYVACVDLHSSSLAKTQAEFRADSDVDYENRMDELVSRKTLRWIRLVLARHPDAEFVLVGAKADVIRHRIGRIAEVKEDLMTRLEDDAAAYVAEVNREIRAVRDRVPESAKKVQTLDRLDKLKKYAGNMAPRELLKS